MSSDATQPAAPDFTQQIATELALPAEGVRQALILLGGGATVPFVARYRKELTRNLDEVQLRSVQEREAYLRELDERRQTVLHSIAEQGKLTPELQATILACTTKNALEDLYLPFKPKRRTRATIARERGLEPLALRILAQPAQGDPGAEAAPFVDEGKGVPDVEAALQGARDIVAEAVTEHAEVRAHVRKLFGEQGLVTASATREGLAARTKFEQYYSYSEPIAAIPSHRYLAVRRGEREGALKVVVGVPPEVALPGVLQRLAHRPASPFASQLVQAVSDALERLLLPSVETDVRVELKMRADKDAIQVFADNLRALLLSAPLGERPVLGVDPGLRTGCKVAVVDSTGRFVENTTLYLSGSADAQARAGRELLQLCQRHRPFAVAVGNGTGGRETEAWVRQTLRDGGVPDVLVVSVNESGASVYSASDLAREEFPELDLTVRGAISIARRLQDPLAELVKIDPKSIGVGQYQHDVHQPLLARSLDQVVESCVNAVGVELNTASAALLTRVAGVGPKLAGKIVAHREQRGAFAARAQLRDVAGLGPRAFEQCAGFIRVRGGAHPLDASAVHPERYKLVERMARDLGVELAQLVGNRELVDRIELTRYVDGEVGEPTLRDILAELLKPGRDPRQSFEPPRFRDDVQTLQDLSPGMRLEGVVTNVTAFGAFVDVGVHQDGLVHVSRLADRFVRDPREVVSPGDRIAVRVLEIDLERKRISLSARSDDLADSGAAAGEVPRQSSPAPTRSAPRRQPAPTPASGPREASPPVFRNNPFADALKGLR